MLRRKSAALMGAPSKGGIVPWSAWTVKDIWRRAVVERDAVKVPEPRESATNSVCDRRVDVSFIYND